MVEGIVRVGRTNRELEDDTMSLLHHRDEHTTRFGVPKERNGDAVALTMIELAYHGLGSPALTPVLSWRPPVQRARGQLPQPLQPVFGRPAQRVAPRVRAHQRRRGRALRDGRCCEMGVQSVQLLPVGPFADPPQGSGRARD
jgi:hypothetical protein